MTPLRVAYVLRVFPKISETFVANELAEMRRRGVEVRILSLRRPAEDLRHELVARAGLDEQTVYDLREFPVTLREFRPQLLHAHFATAATAKARELAAEIGVPFTFTAHRYDLYDKAPSDFADRAAAAGAVVTVSQANLQHIVKAFGVPAAHIHVIPCGVDTERFRPDGDRAKPPLIVCVARLVPFKRIGLLLEACAILRAWGVEFRCAIVGDGPCRDELETARARHVRRGARATPWRSRLGRTARRGSPTTSTRAFLARAPGRLLGRALEDAGGRGRAMSISVSDPFVATRDRAMPSLVFALDPGVAQQHLERQLPRLAGEDGRVHLQAIRVTRHKPGRRCVIEYDVDVKRPDACLETVVLVGKVRAGRSGKNGYRLLDAFWKAGFQADSPDGISVPEPVGTVPEFQIWLQRKVPGRCATDLLAAPGGVALARKIAEAACKVHRTGVPARRRHTISDELNILKTRLLTVSPPGSPWAGRIARLLDAADRLGAATREPKTCGIHRDFYADQVIVDGERLFLLDFDLYCEGDPALDIGNFMGHITEQSLRTLGDAGALVVRDHAPEQRTLE